MPFHTWIFNHRTPLLRRLIRGLFQQLHLSNFFFIGQSVNFQIGPQPCNQLEHWLFKSFQFHASCNPFHKKKDIPPGRDTLHDWLITKDHIQYIQFGVKKLLTFYCAIGIPCREVKIKKKFYGYKKSRRKFCPTPVIT